VPRRACFRTNIGRTTCVIKRRGATRERLGRESSGAAAHPLPTSPCPLTPTSHLSPCPRPTPRPQAFRDPYERVNCISHALPGAAFLVLGFISLSSAAPAWLPRTDGARAWTHDPLGAFCLCAATTHLLSALTHVWPDSVRLEKADHVGIVVLIVGTPLTAWAAHAHGALPRSMLGAVAALLASSALPPAPRVAGFVGSVAVMVAHIGPKLVDWNLGTQLALYGAGAAAFLRNDGHGRGGVSFLTDHHALHYCVTVACCMHVSYLVAAMAGVQDKG